MCPISRSPGGEALSHNPSAGSSVSGKPGPSWTELLMKAPAGQFKVPTSLPLGKYEGRAIVERTLTFVPDSSTYKDEPNDRRRIDRPQKRTGDHGL